MARKGINYPYLGRKRIGDKQYVVMFLEEDYGLVVLNETKEENIIFGKLGDFDEEQFEILPEGECVRLQN